MMLDILKLQFGDCKFVRNSQCLSKSSYINTANTEFYIYDPPNEDQQPIRIVETGDDYQLIVNNYSNEEISIVKTDKCLFPNNVLICDCILFNNNKFYLVEIKSSGKSTRSQQRHRAVEQLGATIESLTNNAVPLSRLDCKAVICFKLINEHPIQAARLSKRAEFLAKYKISLEEGNKIEF